MQLKRSTTESILAYQFLVPALVLILLFKGIPIIDLVIRSFMRFNFRTRTSTFVGIANYMDLFADSSFWNSVWVTLRLNLIINPLQMIVSFTMALLINQKFFGSRMYKALFYIPLGVSLPVTTIYFSILFRPGGVINFLLNSLGFPIQSFLTSPQWALWIVILIATWKGCSFWMIYLHAGLQNIPIEIYEASKIDGSGSIRTFFSITLPLSMKTLLFVLVTDTAINFMLFIPVFMITRGGPDSTTNVLMYEAYRTIFIHGNMGHGMAMIVFLLLMLIIVLLLQFQFANKKE